MKNKFFAGFGAALVLVLLTGAAASLTKRYGAFSGTFTGLATGLTNSAGADLGSAVGGGTGTASYSNASAFMHSSLATSNSAGDVTLKGTSTFLQFLATGNTSGQQYWDFYNGANTFQMRRKTDGGGTVLDNVFIITNGVFVHGIPVCLATNAVAAWPVQAQTPGGAAFVNSNAVVYLLTSSPGSLTWSATNKIAP